MGTRVRFERIGWDCWKVSTKFSVIIGVSCQAPNDGVTDPPSPVLGSLVESR